MSEDRCGKLWGRDEITLACDLLDEGIDIGTMSKSLGRTKASVVTKLCLLGHLYERDGFYYRVITPPFCSYKDVQS